MTNADSPEKIREQARRELERIQAERIERDRQAEDDR